MHTISINEEENLATKFEYLRHLPGISYVTDINCNLQASSIQGSQTLGWSDPSDLVTKSVFDIPNEASEAAELFLEFASTTTRLKKKLTAVQAVYTGNCPITTISEETPIITQNGIVKGLFLQALDITDFFIKNCQSLYRSDEKFVSKLNLPKQYILSPEACPLSLPLRQQEILALMIRGKTMKEVAYALSISPRTVEKHVIGLKENLGCQKKSQIIEKAIDSGFLFHLPETIFGIPNLFK